MIEAQIRRELFFSLAGFRGEPLRTFYRRYKEEDRHGIRAETSRLNLIHLFEHCKRSVPYYARIINDLGDSYHQDPFAYLNRFPILTKETIRTCFEDLKSTDLPHRKWFYTTSGGSTGMQIELIQDYEFSARAGAAKLLYSELVGRKIGEPEVYLWGSLRDITDGGESFTAKMVNQLTQTTFFNAFRMTPEKMRQFIGLINTKRPKLIIAYVEAIYELAKFVEREGLHVVPQSAIMTSAGVLHAFMREKIEKVFQCKVYNRYGSREVGDIACERPGLDGFWVAPWSNYLEIMDDSGERAVEGVDGEILVTSLTNYAMPLIRYKIGDRGILAPPNGSQSLKHSQVLKAIVGRTSDCFRAQNGTIVHPTFFMNILADKDWVDRYQFVQLSYTSVLINIVLLKAAPSQAELDALVAVIRDVMGEQCEVKFQFVQEIAASQSGKYRHTICKIVE